MPNWCDNVLIVKHKRKLVLERVEEAFKEGKLCEEFIPIPEELKESEAPNTKNKKEMLDKYGYESWYDFCVNKWGTKWDIGEGDYGSFSKKRNSLTLSFQSAWSPPIGLYQALIDEGYDVTAYYFESGVGFAGKFDEYGDNHYEISENWQAVQKELPSEIDKMFSISENMKECS